MDLSITDDEYNNIKFKPLSEDDYLISIDRLSRLKRPSKKYLRVYKDILTKHLLSPQLTKKQIENLTAESLVRVVELIWNNSLDYDSSATFIPILDYKYFDYEDEYTAFLMSARLNIFSILKKISLNSCKAKNLRLLKLICEKMQISASVNSSKLLSNAVDLREQYSLLFPIEKIVLVEGITEEILLPQFSKLLDYNFEKNGVYILGAGGKSKVLSLYSDLKNIFKIPVIILLDNDAYPIYSQIKGFLNAKDKMILLQKGEFEDILPLNLLKRTFNNSFYDIEKVTLEDLRTYNKMCDNISDIHKSRGLGEFQKAHFAQLVAKTISYKTDLTDEIKYIIDEIKAT